MLGTTRAWSSRRYQPYFASKSVSERLRNSAPARLAQKFCTSMNSSAACAGTSGTSRLGGGFISASSTTRVDGHPARLGAATNGFDESDGGARHRQTVRVTDEGALASHPG